MKVRPSVTAWIIGCRYAVGFSTVEMAYSYGFLVGSARFAGMERSSPSFSASFRVLFRFRLSSCLFLSRCAEYLSKAYSHWATSSRSIWIWPSSRSV